MIKVWSLLLVFEFMENVKLLINDNCSFVELKMNSELRTFDFSTSANKVFNSDSTIQQSVMKYSTQFVSEGGEVKFICHEIFSHLRFTHLESL